MKRATRDLLSTDFVEVPDDCLALIAEAGVTTVATTVMRPARPTILAPAWAVTLCRYTRLSRDLAISMLKRGQNDQRLRRHAWAALAAYMLEKTGMQAELVVRLPFDDPEFHAMVDCARLLGGVESAHDAAHGWIERAIEALRAREAK